MPAGACRPAGPVRGAASPHWRRGRRHRSSAGRPETTCRCGHPTPSASVAATSSARRAVVRTAALPACPASACPACSHRPARQGCRSRPAHRHRTAAVPLRRAGSPADRSTGVRHPRRARRSPERRCPCSTAGGPLPGWNRRGSRRRRCRCHPGRCRCPVRCARHAIGACRATRPCRRATGRRGAPARGSHRPACSMRCCPSHRCGCCPARSPRRRARHRRRCRRWRGRTARACAAGHRACRHRHGRAGPGCPPATRRCW